MPLGDTVRSLFSCSQPNRQTVFSHAAAYGRGIRTGWAKEIRRCRYFTLPFLGLGGSLTWYLRTIEDFFFLLPISCFVLESSSLKLQVGLVGRDRD